jgi:hypothetical protein
MKRTALIGEYKQSDGWHSAGIVFSNAKEAADWRRRVDEAGGHEHARRTRRVKTSSGAYWAALEGRGNPRRNPSRYLTKAQKKQNASKRAKEKRVALALKKFLHAQNPAVKYDGAAIVKLKGGAVRITPIKAKRGRR